MFVGNLNYRTTKEELVAFLSPAGEIIDAFLPTDRDTGRPRGFGFVTFASEDQAAACIDQFDGVELGGRRLNITPADERGRRGGGRPRRDGPPGGGGGGGGGRGRGRPSPIAQFKRGGRPSDGGGDGAEEPPPEQPIGTVVDPDALQAPIGVAPRPKKRRPQFRDDGASAEGAGADGGGAPPFGEEDWEDKPSWKKKKKKRKGSRRGLRAKKRSL